MEKIKRFISIYIPVTTCTFRCHYCYITHQRLFGGKLPEFQYSPEHVRRALSKERLGGTCLINMCAGGETLLPPNIVGYIRALLEEGHYLMIVTNASVSKRFDEIVQLPKELLERLFFKFSYHYLQLKERNMLDRFFDNVQKVREAGCSFTIEVTPSDELIPYVDELKEEAVKRVGAIPHITIARDERKEGTLPILTDMPKEKYYKFWGEAFKSELFNFKSKIFGVKRKEYCYAGEWSFYVNLLTGDMTQCVVSHRRVNIFKEPDKPIPYLPIGNNCTIEHCFNGHVYLPLGDIPEMDTPTYDQLRNRTTEDGSTWLNETMRSFMATRLYDSNKQHGFCKRLEVNARNLVYILKNSAIKILRKVIRK